MKIAFFDSGLGGITVLNEAMKRMPQEDFVYFADTAHVPYGMKSKDEVLTFVKQSVDTIIQEEVKALVIACNTATSIAISELRRIHHIPIIGMEPAVKPAVEMNRSSGKRVLVFATKLTLQEAKYRELVSRIDDMGMVDSVPLPELVQFCENLMMDGPQIVDYFKTKLAPFDLSNFGTVVLGCTHYPFYRGVLSQILPNHIQIVDGSIGTVNHLMQVLQDSNQLPGTGNGHVKWMCSSLDDAYIKKMEKALAFLQAVK
ncbi:Glutamate racemase 2 [Paenibacillus allorhizoplanae]|uniref:Glutamate racemase n=1 Tax=Paenibacillus allorhizoplanae TaxID=2905648 RepID=A0ABM9CQB8_9BACL|nr:glutamate racemase [Paenibacillus allorhizoplanae]CAH1219832.1 Glutamate racemase 2 [Paenibacillus allorhizoplanae]